jgi:hypothetical protein
MMRFVLGGRDVPVATSLREEEGFVGADGESAYVRVK